MADAMRWFERLMAMDERTWRRHANPWSVHTRIFATLPLLTLAVWSRVWIGWWALLAVAVAVAWVWLNPRLWPEPARFDSWASRGVLGERIWLEHRAAIPAHHRRMAAILAGLSAAGAVVLVAGLVALWWEGAVFGLLLTAIPKVWFVDRMAWLHDDWVRAGKPVPGMTEEGTEA